MIKTGKTPLSLMTYFAIMSISLIVNLPGLAITPMLGRLHEIFPHTTQIEDQLLTVLPNLLIIPFVLLSGKLSLAKNKIVIIVAALLLFTASAIGYMFASSMSQLIIISCLIGAGAGLLIPFSTGLIADSFCGAYRLKQMGIQSGISNTAVMVATFVVGWLCHGNWHLPFIVYLVGVIPLVLSVWLKKIPHSDLADTMSPDDGCDADCAGKESGKTSTSSQSQPVGAASPDGFYTGRLISLIGIYFFITFATISISYYCPFLIEKKDWSDSLTGTVTAIYFLFIFLPGYTLPWFVRKLKGNLFLIASITMTIGIGLFVFIQHPVAMCLGAAMAGIGYGICQPVLYDKSSLSVKSEKKATLALALVLAANYAAIVVAPFIIDFFRDLFNAANVTGFAFIVCFALLIPFCIIVWRYRRSFAFSISSEEESGK